MNSAQDVVICPTSAVSPHFVKKYELDLEDDKERSGRWRMPKEPMMEHLMVDDANKLFWDVSGHFLFLFLEHSLIKLRNVIKEDTWRQISDQGSKRRKCTRSGYYGGAGKRTLLRWNSLDKKSVSIQLPLNAPKMLWWDVRTQIIYRISTLSLLLAFFLEIKLHLNTALDFLKNPDYLLQYKEFLWLDVLYSSINLRLEKMILHFY